MEDQGWIGVDLDGTLAKYDGWKGISQIGDPVPDMLERVKRWLSDGTRVKIFTARVGKNFRDRDQARVFIEYWCEVHLGVKLEVTCEKDFGMIELWDDRCVQVEANTGRRMDGLA